MILPLQSIAQIETLGVDSITIDTTIQADSIALDTIALPQTETEEEKPLEQIVPWKFHVPLGADLTASDSTLRWQIWPDWTHKLNREPGIITYRMGTSLRSNAVQYFAHEPSHQKLYWEGIPLNDPVSGNLNWSLIPQHKIDKVYGQDKGTYYRTTYYLNQYYLNKPLSRLIYNESKFSNRDLEFEVSHNLSQKTNITLSYWDRRAGGEYRNSEVAGQQIYVKGSHHLGKRRYIKFNYINNNLEVGRPFGYLTGDLRTFHFDHYRTNANETSGSSREINNLFALNFYQRSADSTKATDNLHAGIFHRKIERTLEYSADSTSYNIRTAGLNARKWLDIGSFLEIEGGTQYEHYFPKRSSLSPLPITSWGQFTADGKAVFKAGSFFSLEGETEVNFRTDGFQNYRLQAGAEILFWKLHLSPSLSSGTIMPTLQQLYWESDTYQGSSDLINEKIQEGSVELSYNFSRDSRIGARVQHKEMDNRVMVGTDSTFANMQNYASQSATAYLNWDSKSFEIDGSASLHKFTDSFLNPTGSIPMQNDPRLWIKGGVYWKGYLFDRATYLKAGLSGMMTPFQYQADHYQPQLDYWQATSADQELPAYNRLDIDISARVRSIMFVLRLENVLDDVNQLGYFETAQYPMSQRRFIFGVRALFRN